MKTLTKKSIFMATILCALIVLISAFSMGTAVFAEELVDHNVISQSEYGEDIIFNSDVVYESETNVISSKVYYNHFSKSTIFKTLDMTNISGITYSATLEGADNVLPQIYYYIEVVTDNGTIFNGTPQQPHRINVAEKTGYVTPNVIITEANSVGGNRSDFVELKNTSNAPIALSKLSLKMHEYICDGSDLTIDEIGGNYKGEAFFALNSEDRLSKIRITDENEVMIAPGEIFVIFVGKAAEASTEAGGLSSAAAYNFDYVYSQYTASRVGPMGSNIENVAEIENTRAFLAVSDPYGPDSAVIPDPAASYNATAYGTMWTVIYDGEIESRVVLGMNNDGTAQLEDKSTTRGFSDTAGFGSVQYSPYFVDITYNETTITVQSRLTKAREVGITIGADKQLPSLDLLMDNVDLDTMMEVRTITLADYILINEGAYYGNEFSVSYSFQKNDGDATAAVDGTIEVTGEGNYTIIATFASDEFESYSLEQTIVAMADNAAPELSNLITTENATMGDDISFNINITDNKLVNTANLYYKFASNANWINVELEAGENDNYSYIITNVKAPKVFYYLEASDLIGNIGSMASSENPYSLDITAIDNVAPRLIITEANAIRSKRADFIEIYNNSNKPIALSEVSLSRYDYIVKSGSFNTAFLERKPNGTTGVAISSDDGDLTSRSAITSDNEVYIESGTSFVIFIGNMNIGELSPAPYNLGYIRSFYNETTFPGIDTSGLIDNVNAFVASTPMAGSPTYTTVSYGTAYSVSYKGEEQTIAVIGMDNNGEVNIDDASVGNNDSSIGSIQFSNYTMSITFGEDTEVFQTRISDNRQAIINFNTILDEQISTELFVESPIITLNANTKTIYGSTGMFDLTSMLDIVANGYENDEIVISANDGNLIEDLTQYAYSIGNKAITFTVSSPTSVFASYDIVLEFNVINAPTINAENQNTGTIIYGQIDTLDVNDYFTIDEGDFAGLYTVGIQSDIPLVENLIQVAGNYNIIVTLTANNEGAFEDVILTFSISVTAQSAPSIISEETQINAIIKGEWYDLNPLFAINKGSFEDAIVDWSVTKDNETITINDGKIVASAGIYKVRLTITPKNSGDFQVVESEELTLTLVKMPPSIDVDSTVKDGVVSIVLDENALELDITSYFEINENSFADDFVALYTVKKGDTLVEISNNKFTASVGEYTITLTLSSNDESFTDIVKTVQLNITKDSPTVSASDKEFKVKKGESIDLGQLYTIDNKHYDANEYAVSYIVKLGSEAKEITGSSLVIDKAGVYEVSIILASKDGSFETIMKTINVTVSIKSNTALIISLSVLGALLVAAGAFLLIRLKKKA